MGLVAASAIAFGVLPVLGKVVYAAGAQPVGVLAIRFSVAGLLLLAVCAATSQPLPRGPALAGLAALGGIGYVCQSLAYFSALTRIPAGLVALLLYLYPGIVVVISAVLLHHRPSRAGVGCLLASLVGTGLTIGPVAGGQGVGVALGVLAALAYAGYIVASSRLVIGVGPLAATTVVMCSAGLVYAALAAASRPRLPSTGGGWVALLAIAVVPTVAASLALFAGIGRLGPGDTAVISTLEPVVSVALAAAVLGERLRGTQLVGGVLVITAVIALARLGTRGRQPSRPPVKATATGQ